MMKIRMFVVWTKCLPLGRIVSELPLVTVPNVVKLLSSTSSNCSNSLINQRFWVTSDEPKFTDTPPE